MALRGSLLEFELPNIFQLIGNDGKTGQLVLYHKDDEAFVIFSHGTIIAAGNSGMNLQTVLFKYLISVKHYSEEELNELLYLCQGEMRVFTQELVGKRYISKEELTSIARVTIEDLACELFLWEHGHYRFDSLESVDDYAVGAISLSSDAVTMEAMRRVDEWKRIRKSILPNAVFIRVKPNDAVPAGLQPPENFDPAAQIFFLIDGVSSVETIVKRAFFTDFRVFETLLMFWQNNRIMPSQDLQPKGKAAFRQEDSLKRPGIFNTNLATLAIVHACAALIFVMGYFLNNNILYQVQQTSQAKSGERSMEESEIAVRTATLFYHESRGVFPTRVWQLKECGLITPHEASNYKSRKSTPAE